MANYTKPVKLRCHVEGAITNNAGTTPYLSDSTVSVGVDKKIGVSQPNWRQIIRNRADASTPYTREIIKTNLPEYYGRHVWYNALGKNVSYANGFSSGLVHIPSSIFADDAALADLALRRLNRKLDKARGDFKLIAPTVELREIRSTVRDLFKYMAKNLPKLNKRNVLIFGKNLSSQVLGNHQLARNAWLQWSFGIQPLINDVENARKALANWRKAEHHIPMRYSGGASKTWTASKKGSAGYLLPGASTTFSYADTDYCTLSYKYKALVDFGQFVSDNTYTMQDHFHLHLGDLVPAAYELIPFSWLVDYVSTLGAWLDDHFSSSTDRVIYAVKNRKFTIHRQVDVWPNQPIDQWRYTPLQIDSTVFNRVVLPKGLPNVELHFKSVDEILGNPYLYKQVLNLLAVAAGSYRH